MPEIRSCCLVVVDVQSKLAQLMHGRESLFKNIQILIKAAKILFFRETMVHGIPFETVRLWLYNPVQASLTLMAAVWQ